MILKHVEWIAIWILESNQLKLTKECEHNDNYKSKIILFILWNQSNKLILFDSHLIAYNFSKLRLTILKYTDDTLLVE